LETCIGLLKLPGASNVQDLQADTSKHIKISVGSIFNKCLLPGIGVRTVQELETSVQYRASLPHPPPKFPPKESPFFLRPTLYIQHDQFPAELIQAGGEILLSAIHKLVNSVWKKVELPDQ
jgi:hypothetical protein